jgi:hypothetical protein
LSVRRFLFLMLLPACGGLPNPHVQGMADLQEPNKPKPLCLERPHQPLLLFTLPAEVYPLRICPIDPPPAVHNDNDRRGPDERAPGSRRG